MAADDVFPAEMPDHPSSPISPLDGDTAERLLSGRLDPDDAPPAYAGVARLLRAAAAPAGPDELASLAGMEEALALFRAARAGTAWVGDRPAGAGRWSGSPGRPAGLGGRLGSRGRPARVRRRLVAVALTGVLVAGGAAAGGAAATGLWTAGGVPSPGRLRSPTGGPGAGEAGSGTSASGSGVGTGSVSGPGGSGLLRPTGSGEVTERARAVARHGGGGGSRGGGAAHGAKPARTPKTGKAKAGKPKKPGAEKPHPGKPEPKGPKATPSHGANHAGESGTSRRTTRR